MMTETNEEEVVSVPSEHDQLILKLKAARAVLLDRQSICARIKRELSKEEDRLVEANEALRAATEALKAHEQTQVLDLVDEDLREIEIARLRASLPELMKRIENEQPIILKDLMMDEEDEDE